MREKRKYKLDQPMKRINWTKIQTRNLKENSIWVRVEEDRLASSDVCQLLVDNFSTKVTKPSNFIVKKVN